MNDLPVIVVGAGAAGLMAAIFAATEGPAPVVLLERTRDGGRKILVSGGGRCNVLPSAAAAERFVTDSSPHSLRNLLLAWPLDDQRRFFEQEAGIPLALEAASGKFFPRSNRARDVRDGLLALAARRGVQWVPNATVVDAQPPGSAASPWEVRLADGRQLTAAALVLATGGLSLPGSGSDGLGLELLRRLGHTIHPTYPALTPLTAHPPPFAHLAGISLDITLRAPVAGSLPAASTHGGFLFTHRGYSGPAVLDLSHLAVRSNLGHGHTDRRPLLVQWTPLDGAAWEQELQRGSGATVAATLRRHLPDRLAEALASTAAVPPNQVLAQLRRDERQRLVATLTAMPLPWTGDEGYAKAEVTGGGVALSEVAAATLESRLHPRLFLCGELLDAFGPIGGHNFQWAWSTGRAAGRAAARTATTCASASASAGPGVEANASDAQASAAADGAAAHGAANC